MQAKGSFEIQMQAEPPYDIVDGVSLARVGFSKQFTGDLTANSQVAMLGARTPVENSAGYAALERIVGSVGGKHGSFVVIHLGILTRGQQELSIRIVPDSGTAELSGISGSMGIRITEGKHDYTLDYDLP